MVYYFSELYLVCENKMDFFDLNKPCGVQRIDVGQTRGFIETENEDYKKTKKKPLKVGKEYVHKYVLREKKEFTRFCKIKASSNEGIELDNVNNCTELTSVGTYPDINALDNEQSTALYAEYFDKSEHRSNWMESKDKFTINQFKSKV